MRPVHPRVRAFARSAAHALRLLMLIVTALMPLSGGAQPASPTPLDLLRELRHQSEEITSAAAESDWDGAAVAAGAARAALEGLQALMEEPGAGGDARRLERRFIDAGDLGDLLTGVEDALGSRDLPALMRYATEVTELANRMLTNCELDACRWPPPAAVPAATLEPVSRGGDSDSNQSRSQLKERVWK
jgi:hypothetical protein